MKTDNRKKVSEILQNVLDIETSERQNCLDELNLNPDIRREVESLLSFEADAENLIQLSMVKFLKDFLYADKLNEHTLIGKHIGAYKLVRELGGGMGATYLAEKMRRKITARFPNNKIYTVHLVLTFAFLPLTFALFSPCHHQADLFR